MPEPHLVPRSWEGGACRSRGAPPAPAAGADPRRAPAAPAPGPRTAACRATAAAAWRGPRAARAWRPRGEGTPRPLASVPPGAAAVRRTDLRGSAAATIETSDLAPEITVQMMLNTRSRCTHLTRYDDASDQVGNLCTSPRHVLNHGRKFLHAGTPAACCVSAC